MFSIFDNSQTGREAGTATIGDTVGELPKGLVGSCSRVVKRQKEKDTLQKNAGGSYDLAPIDLFCARTN